VFNHSQETTDFVQKQRFVLKVAGESGQGINSIGEVFAKVFKQTGWYVFGYREYPSLIKGGYSSYQLDVSAEPINSSSAYCDVLVCMSRVSVHKYFSTVAQNGVLIHCLPKFELTAEEETFAAAKNITFKYVPADKLALDIGQRYIFSNTVMTGIVCWLLGLDFSLVESLIKAEFADKPQVLDLNMACIKAGYELRVEGLTAFSLPEVLSSQPKPEDRRDDYLITGNHALALGAVAAGVRAYYAYPMTPSSSILTYIASIYHKTGMLVKQIEDEISVAQMTLGSMHMGTRALCGTAGGGFDLMTESLSMAGITEIPFVCIIGQRPGPATGLPTWTSQGDLNLAVYAGHGEYARCVIGVSDPVTAYEAVQKAFNLAEKFQIPVLVLTEKQIAESIYAVESFPEPIPIERNLVSQENLATLKSEQRYDTAAVNGVSPRWFPGTSPATFDANSDEHVGDGSLTEESAPVKAMYDKRMRKEPAVLEALPEPEFFGSEDADIIFVGWGSTKATMHDIMRMLPNVAYLHYEYVYPIKTERFTQLAAKAKRMVLIENNYMGQLGALLTRDTGYQFKESLLKYDGRPFFVEDIIEFCKGQSSKQSASSSVGGVS
jgi:2-oxoglutarate ferredoxin oxidoreductase subunit alpha